ncbi:hypothetical protein TrST_g12690 [Triparma strigata]|uniref:Thioredoxin domain-containing protein n=1 Tax=Triparma strigata TaxID=1606541 RepID=A0A9W7BX84_9STRA|nr:hypothetical protein TrST_g12690 [Triparma strigata]
MKSSTLRRNIAVAVALIFVSLAAITAFGTHAPPRPFAVGHHTTITSSALFYGSEVDDGGYDSSYHDPSKREERRKLRLERKSAKPKLEKQEILVLNSQEEYLEWLEKCASNDSLAVIKFHASWCKSCQAFSRKFQQLSSLSPSSISYASLEFSANPKLCRSLGVTHLPSVQIYKGSEGKVESFSCSPKRFDKVKVKINEWLDAAVFKVKAEPEI